MCVEDSYRFDRDYILTRESLNENAIEFRGMSGSTKLVYDVIEDQWKAISLRHDSLGSIHAIYNGTKKFPIGRLDWYFVGICTDNPNTTYSLPLKLSKVIFVIFNGCTTHFEKCLNFSI